MKTNMTSDCLIKPLNEAEKRLLNVASFNLDIVLQLHRLREQRQLSQAELAALVGTKQQSISRMESPGYDRHSLSMLRKVAEELGAFVDVILVPEEKLDSYLERRYQPLLMETPPTALQWQESEVSRSSEDWHYCSEQTIVPQLMYSSSRSDQGKEPQFLYLHDVSEEVDHKTRTAA